KRRPPRGPRRAYSDRRGPDVVPAEQTEDFVELLVTRSLDQREATRETQDCSDGEAGNNGGSGPELRRVTMAKAASKGTGKNLAPFYLDFEDVPDNEAVDLKAGVRVVYRAETTRGMPASMTRGTTQRLCASASRS